MRGARNEVLAALRPQFESTATVALRAGVTSSCALKLLAKLRAEGKAQRRIIRHPLNNLPKIVYQWKAP